MDKENIYTILQKEFPGTDKKVLDIIAGHIVKSVFTDMETAIKESRSLIEIYDRLEDEKPLPAQARAEVISEMMLMTKNNRLIGSEVLNHKALAKIAPEGEQDYFNNEIFLLIKEITKTRFGYIDWNEAGQPMNEKELTSLAINYYQTWSSFGEREETVAIDDLLEFFEWYWLIYELKKLKEQAKDHSSLWEQLVNKGYISNAPLERFNIAMNGGDIPAIEENKIIWSSERKMPSEAIEFCDYLGMEYEVWNKYFRLGNAKRLNKTNRSTGERRINDILSDCNYPDVRQPDGERKHKEFR
jgi:hypothetical protein